MLFSSVYPIENSNFTSYKAKCKIKSSLKIIFMSMFMKAIKKPVASSETDNCLIIAKNRTFRFRCMYNVLVMNLHLKSVPPKCWQLRTKFWKLKNHIWQKVSPVFKFLNKNLSDGILKPGKIKLEVFLNSKSKKEKKS